MPQHRRLYTKMQGLVKLKMGTNYGNYVRTAGSLMYGCLESSKLWYGDLSSFKSLDIKESARTNAC